MLTHPPGEIAGRFPQSLFSLIAHLKPYLCLSDRTMRSPKWPAAAEDQRSPARAPPMPSAGPAVRRKGGAAREWRVISTSGRSYVEEVGRHSIMERTGLPARDLRALDPFLSYPSTILGRERAIVVNLELIKAIITATEVWIPNSKDPLVERFVQDLHSRVLSASGAPQHEASETNNMEEAVGKPTSCWPSFPQCTIAARHGNEASKDIGSSANEIPEGPGLENEQDRSAKIVPFEFRALEVCLECACRCLESETSSLEQEAYPALDELTSKISTLNLERVRQIKSRLVGISGRVQKVRDELEHLLDDDMDMAEMYLTEKLAYQRVGESSSRLNIESDTFEQDDAEDEVMRNETDDNSTYESVGGIKPNIEELEMLLEAYFVQIDGTLNKLYHLREYVDDTEDYINIMLDEKQNQLLQMGVMLSTATVVATGGVVVVGLFGMNIGIDLYDESTPHIKFWETTFGTTLGSIMLYILAIGFGKRSGLLQ